MAKIKINIISDELYPYYFIAQSDWGLKVEVSQETADRWERVAKEFNQMQNEMAELEAASLKKEREEYLKQVEVAESVEPAKIEEL